MTGARCAQILAASKRKRVMVVGDLMLDQFVFGKVTRISPEAPVPVVALESERFMPGGAANVAFNLGHLGVPTSVVGIVGRDEPGRCLCALLRAEGVDARRTVTSPRRRTALKTRIASGQQQIARLDRETHGPLDAADSAKLMRQVEAELARADAVIIGDYAKGVVTQHLLDAIRRTCQRRGTWISLDPKPGHPLDLRGLSLLTPNRKEAFDLAGLQDGPRASNPLHDVQLMRTAERLMGELKPSILLVTLSEQGMLLCTEERSPMHIPTVSREVFDVSGAGDTVIASFTMAMAAGATAVEAALISNHAAGVVVGKFGTATVSPRELRDSFRSRDDEEEGSDALR